MSLVLLSADLMGASRVEAAARQAGLAYCMVGTIDAAIEASNERGATLVVADLATPGLKIDTLVERLRQRDQPAPAVVAYGPHVHETILAAAQAAGCDEVLSRGQFMSRIDAIVVQFASAAS